MRSLHLVLIQMVTACNFYFFYFFFFFNKIGHLLNSIPFEHLSQTALHNQFSGIHYFTAF